ncbi:MAG: penicillin-binding protein 2 [Chlamydiota bacterium]
MLGKKGPFTSSDVKRIIGLSIFVFFLFCLLVMRFYQVQVIEQDKWTKQGDSQYQHVVIEPFMRGTFYSNTSIKKKHPEKDQPFVVDVPKFHLFVDPDSIPVRYKKEIASHLISLLSLQEKEKEKVIADIYRKSRSRKMAMWLDNDKREEIQQWWSPYSSKRKIVQNALYFTKDYKRQYPFGSLLGQVLHTIQEEKDPHTMLPIPTGGLELSFQHYLQGKFGKRKILRSLRHPLDLGTLIELPENGADVFLTVNHCIQAIAEEELAKGVHAAKAKGGWAIMMDPYTGEILALAQYPFFDLSKYREYFNQPLLQEHTKVKSVTDAYEPGSAFKPLMLAVALKANEDLKKKGMKPLFSCQEKISTSNGKISNSHFALKDTHPHSYLNFYMGIQKSSNVYMSKIVTRIIEKMGEEWYRKTYEELFHLGKKTNIELPGESAGVLPSIGKKHANGKLEWSKETPYTLAIGHNVLVNTLQLLRAYAIIANGGMDVEPSIIHKVAKMKEDGTEEVYIDHTVSKHPPKRLLSEASCKELITGMKYVTKMGGTSRLGDIMGYTEGGKSGTSEKIINGRYSKQKYISTFVGFAPASHPYFVMIVVIDEPEVRYIPGLGKSYHGGTCASPVFREIGKKTLEYLGVAPDDPFGYPYGDPRRSPEKADWNKEIKSLGELYKHWNGK